MAERRLAVGMVGLGVGASHILDHAGDSSLIEIRAGADVDPAVRARFHAAFPDAAVYESAEELAQDPNIEASWVATPNRFHSENAVTLANGGKHVVVQKPMAITMEEAERMVSAAERNNVTLIAGNTQSYATPIRMMRQIVRSGELGPLRAVNIFAYHDWLLKPHRPDDMVVAEGGGMVYRGAPHHIDSIRLIGGGLLASVRGSARAWMPERPAPGYCAAYMEFTDGTPATMIQNSYGYFVADEFAPWGARSSPYAKRAQTRKGIRDGTRDEAAQYAARGERASAPANVARTLARAPAREWATDLGLIIVSCELGDIRQSPEGVYVYSDNGIREVKLPKGSLWDTEIAELHAAVVHGREPVHSGRWGMATLEVAFGLMESSTTHQDVQLARQTAVPDDDLEENAIYPEAEVELV